MSSWYVFISFWRFRTPVAWRPTHMAWRCFRRSRGFMAV